jgi:hypothetical protein
MKRLGVLFLSAMAVVEATAQSEDMRELVKFPPGRRWETG